MNFSPIRPDVVKYEMRVVRGEDPFSQQQRTPGAFGRFLSGVGRFFGAVAAPLSLIFPPAAIGAAGMYGVSQIGDTMQVRAYNRMVQQQSTPQTISYPGLDSSPYEQGGMIQPSRAVGAVDTQARNDSVMDVLLARNDMMLESAQKL